MKTTQMPLDQITVLAGSRQRSEVQNLEVLKASLMRVGQLQPLILSSSHILLAGERRYSAMRELGWTTAAVTIRDPEEEEDEQLVELDENIRRDELPWKDFCAALLSIHKILSGKNADWTQQKTAEYIGLSPSELSRRLDVAKELLLGTPSVVDAPAFSAASNFVIRQKERKAALEEEQIQQTFLPTSSTPPSPDLSPPTDSADTSLSTLLFPDNSAPHPFINADWIEWSKTYSGPKFNFLHCDFPYGINVDKHDGAHQAEEGYTDTPEVYFRLLSHLTEFTQTHVAQSAHMIFWYSPTYRRETQDALRAAGWTVAERDLIWYRSDQKGILPDPQRGPRWVYETALFCTRGDRKIVRAKNNLFPYPAQKEIHKSEKPAIMLLHFFNMLVDETTIMLDPTCGSGNAAHAASYLSPLSCTMLEVNPTFFNNAVRHYENFYKENVDAVTRVGY